MFLAASATVLPVLSSTASGRSPGMICRVCFFVSRGIGRLPWFAPFPIFIYLEVVLCEGKVGRGSSILNRKFLK